MINFLLYAALAVFFYMSILFVIAMFKRDNSIADIGWGLGFAVVALLTFFLEQGFTARHILVTALVVIWGMRLATHIYLRHRGKGEDPRYAAWRKEWGNWVIIRSFFQVFMLQGLLLLFIVYVVIAVNSSSGEGLSVLDICGLAVWIIGFLFESIGDFQLKKFIANKQNKGRILTTGLWRYTRHPNYFGEALFWVSMVPFAVSSGMLSRHFALVLIGPALMAGFFRFSCRLMDVRSLQRRPGYQEIIDQVSAMIPWRPKKTQYDVQKESVH